MVLKKVLLAFSLLLYGVAADAQDTLRSNKIITKAQLVGIGHLSLAKRIHRQRAALCFAYATR